MTNERNVPESVKLEADDLAKDLIDILDKHIVAQYLPTELLRDLLVDLSVYCVNRDYRAMQHGFQLDRADS